MNEAVVPVCDADLGIFDVERFPACTTREDAVGTAPLDWACFVRVRSISFPASALVLCCGFNELSRPPSRKSSKFSTREFATSVVSLALPNRGYFCSCSRMAILFLRYSRCVAVRHNMAHLASRLRFVVIG